MPDFNADKFFNAEFEPYHKDIPVPTMAYFFHVSPEAERKIAYVEKLQELFKKKKNNCKSVNDLKVLIARLIVVATEWKIEKFGSHDDDNLETKRNELQKLAIPLESEVIRPEAKEIEQLEILIKEEESKLAKQLEALNMAAAADKEQANLSFRIISLDAATLGKIKATGADKVENIGLAIKAALQQGASKEERFQGFLEKFQIKDVIDSVADNTFKTKLAWFTNACFYPCSKEPSGWRLFDLPMALLISEHRPAVFEEIINEIAKAFGEGSVIKKPM